MNNKIKCIISIGHRCYTSMYLKELGLKQYSCLFDNMNIHNIKNVIYLINKDINKISFLTTKNINELEKYNNMYGHRSGIYFIDNVSIKSIKNNVELYHKLSLPHYDMTDDKNKQHFIRCQNRLKIIKENKISVLFCYFFHYECGDDIMPKYSDIIFVYKKLSSAFNCKMLVIFFGYDEKEQKMLGYENLNIIYFNENNIDFSTHEKRLKDIFINYYNIDKDYLMKYDDFHI